ncbi:MAG: thioredoxin family protein [Planctomycetota bacterium]|nr:MAG: thioredoxin family protein [Planctomycetota bacterium]
MGLQRTHSGWMVGAAARSARGHFQFKGLRRPFPQLCHSLLVGFALVAAAALLSGPAGLPGLTTDVAGAEHQGAWHTDYEQALAAAERTGRPVLTVFTGSDWCPHCKTLEQNVLFTEEFRSWADANVILLMLDLPQHGISDLVRDQRSAVCRKYGVKTFPSVLLLGPDGARIAERKGYKGQLAAAWILDISQHLPEPTSPEVVAGTKEGVLESLDDAIETARGSKRPILLVVASPGDKGARSHSDSLISDPEFAPFVRENFVVAYVPPTAPSGSQTALSMENLLGGVELAPESVELIVTDDGQTPLFSQSGSQPPARIVSGLRRFLAARQASRFGETPRR